MNISPILVASHLAIGLVSTMYIFFLRPLAEEAEAMVRNICHRYNAATVDGFWIVMYSCIIHTTTTTTTTTLSL